MRLAPLIVVGSVPGALLVGAADRARLEVIIGAALLGTLLTTALVRIPPVSGAVPAAVASTAGGFLNTAVGVAAPAMLVYAQATKRDQRSFAATLQPIFFTMGAVSVLTKVRLGAAPLSSLRRRIHPDRYVHQAERDLALPDGSHTGEYATAGPGALPL